MLLDIVENFLRQNFQLLQLRRELEIRDRVVQLLNPAHRGLSLLEHCIQLRISGGLRRLRLRLLRLRLRLLRGLRFGRLLLRLLLRFFHPVWENQLEHEIGRQRQRRAADHAAETGQLSLDRIGDPHQPDRVDRN